MRNVRATLVTLATLLVTAPLAAQQIVDPPIGGGKKDRPNGVKPSIEILVNDCAVVGRNLEVTTVWDDSDPEPDVGATVTKKEAKLLIKIGNGKKNQWMETSNMVVEMNGALGKTLYSTLSLCSGGMGVNEPGTAITALVSLTTTDAEDRTTVFSATCEDYELTLDIDESDNEIPADIDDLCAPPP
jgi:hypothetical protein